MKGHLSQKPRRRQEDDLAYDLGFWASMTAALLYDLCAAPYRLLRRPR